MLKQPGHFTSMKKELGDCTKRFSLWRRCSSSFGGWSRSISPMEMCAWQNLQNSGRARRVRRRDERVGEGEQRQRRAEAIVSRATTMPGESPRSGEYTA